MEIQFAPLKEAHPFAILTLSSLISPIIFNSMAQAHMFISITSKIATGILQQVRQHTLQLLALKGCERVSHLCIGSTTTKYTLTTVELSSTSVCNTRWFYNLSIRRKIIDTRESQ